MKRLDLTDPEAIRAIEAMEQIKSFNTGFQISSFISNYKQWGTFSPKQLLTVLSILITCGIEYIPYDFKVNINSVKFVEQIYKMSPTNKNLVWEVLTPDQKSYYQNTVNRYLGK